MSGPISHGGWRRHVRIARCGAHDDFGSMPASPDWKCVPVLEGGFTLKATSPRFEPETLYGGMRRSVALHHRQVVGGDLVTLPWPELARYLLDMALMRVESAGQNCSDLYRHVVDHFTPPDPRRYCGVAVNKMRMESTHTDGWHETRITLSCIAQREAENDSLVEGDFDYTGISPVPFMASFALLWVDSVLVADVENWSLTVENSIGSAPFGWSAAAGAGVRGHAIAGKRTISLELSDLGNDDRFNRAIREGSCITFQARWDHPGGPGT